MFHNHTKRYIPHFINNVNNNNKWFGLEGVIEPTSTFDLEVRFHPQLKGGHYNIPAATPSTASKADKEKDKDKDRPPRLKWEETIAFKVKDHYYVIYILTNHAG